MATSVTKPSPSSSSSAKQPKSPTIQHSSQPSPATPTQPNPKTTTNPFVSNHLAMVELKSRVLSALSKLSDRDTHQVAVDDLERIIRTLPTDAVPMLVSTLSVDPPDHLHPSSKPSPASRRESLRLLSLLASALPAACAPHVPKIISHIVKRLKDSNSDSSIREACRDTAGTLASVYLRNAAPGNGFEGMFVKPFLETMAEQNKVVQGGAAMCLAKVVECAGMVTEGEVRVGPNVAAVGPMFQRLCPRICKMLSGQSFLAKGALLSVVSSLAQVGAISPQSVQQVLQTVRDCLENSDWTTRKAAAETLVVMASNPVDLIGENAAATVAALEACRFDKVKPVRESMTEALQMWKKISGEDSAVQEQKDGSRNESADADGKLDCRTSMTSNEKSEVVKESLQGSFMSDSESAQKGKGGMSEKAAVLLKKKAPSINVKELNTEFFQKLETRISDDLPVEVVLPRKGIPSQSHDNDESVVDEKSKDLSSGDGTSFQGLERRTSLFSRLQVPEGSSRDKGTEQRGFRSRDLKIKPSDADVTSQDPLIRLNASQSDPAVDGSLNNKSNWITIQKQLTLLERQQTNLMNMLQDFMGGSHDSMVTLESRVRGLERIVEEMARDLSISSGRRGGSSMMGFELSPGRSSSSKYNGFHESKLGRGSDARFGITDRFFPADGPRGRDASWREHEMWDSFPYSSSRNMSSNHRRNFGTGSVESRMPWPDRSGDQVNARRAWDKGQGPFRLGEGPSARSAWQASKDEATLEAIRVVGEDRRSNRVGTRVAIPELDGEALTEDNVEHEKGPLWEAWTRAMDALHVDDVESAYAEVLSSGDAMLLAKLMEQTGPAVDLLSNDVANEVLHAVCQLLMEESFFDISLTWLQQLSDLVAESGPDVLGIPLQGKRDILLTLHEALAVELPEDWQGPAPDQIMTQLASSWGLDLQKILTS